MRKHFQVVLPAYQALLLLPRGPDWFLVPWVFCLGRVDHPQDSPGLQLSGWPGASCPRPWPEAADRKAKLRLLAPALRRALRATVPHPQAPPSRHALLLLTPDTGPTPSWPLAQWLFVCLFPADAAPLRIHWVVV
jgi:hypothetical protein